jgi:predicted metal-dependent enzyme (double-stranded beta helix superfamily)
MGRIERFAESVDTLLRERAPDAALVPRIARLLEPLVAEGDWLPASVSEPVPGRPYSQYLLHLAPDSSWSFVSFVWPAGSSTPVHDHGCWGVVGVYQGEETETAFRLVEGEREAGPVTLEPRATRVMRVGDVATIVPPDDVHQVSNRGAGTAISLHVYGSNIGLQERHTFDRETGAVKRFVSGYDPPRPVAGEDLR